MTENTKIAGTFKNISETKVVAAAHDNEDILWDFKDGFESVRKARRLEGMLYGSRVYGNQTSAIEVKASAEDAIKAINLEYQMTRYLIDEINNLVGGNIVDMRGSNRTVCLRFYNTYRNVI